MAQLIDASVFIDIERRRLPFDVLTALDEPYALATITASELLAGVHRAASSARRQSREAFIEDILARVPILPFDLPAARTLARVSAALDRAGQPIGLYDLLLAATALTYGHAVLTYNVRHFERVPGLIVRQPTW